MRETDVQQMVAEYLSLRYPSVLFHSDFGTGTRLTYGQALRQSRQNAGRRGWPDIFIAEKKKGRGGLFLELKLAGTRLKKRDGSYASKHIAEQAEVLKALEKKGYAAKFARGFNEARDYIDEYLGAKKERVEI